MNPVKGRQTWNIPFGNVSSKTDASFRLLYLTLSLFTSNKSFQAVPSSYCPLSSIPMHRGNEWPIKIWIRGATRWWNVFRRTSNHLLHNGENWWNEECSRITNRKRCYFTRVVHSKYYWKMKNIARISKKQLR